MIMEKQVTQMKADFFSKSYYCGSQVQVTKGCKPLSLVKNKTQNTVAVAAKSRILQGRNSVVNNDIATQHELEGGGQNIRSSSG